MPYLHWATSGDSLDHRNAVIKELAQEFRNPFYRRPTPEEIDAEGEITTKMKILRAFLHPKNDRCLHIRRTLDQYYYSTLVDADERTVDQVVYKFAKKQHFKIKQEEKDREIEKRERRKWEKSESSLRSSRSWVQVEMETGETAMQDETRAEVSWDPPKVMMVNQLWMVRLCSTQSVRRVFVLLLTETLVDHRWWYVPGGHYSRSYAYILRTDTVITSFPAKNKSDLSMDDNVNAKDYMEGDDIYDSTDIWRAVQRELRHKTTYGQRTAKSALDLAWTIADQARGVFQKRNLHPHLQFIQMFEMEINEIVSSAIST
jgi:hypothetical protein